MVAKLFTAPFARSGDKEQIPDQQQLDGSVSYESGFGPDYERQLEVDPSAKNINRRAFNDLMFDTTNALQEMQGGFGVSTYNLAFAQNLPGGGYPVGAVIPRADGRGLWVNITVANTSNPDTGGAGWLPLTPDGSNFATDTGVANALVAAFNPAITARNQNRFLIVKVKTANNGPTTINDGLGARPILGLAQQPLQGGELIANGLAWLQWNATNNSYILALSTGGALQVKDGTRALHAPNVGQIQNQSTIAFGATGTATAQVLTPFPVATAYVTGQLFNVAFSTNSGANPTINVSGLGPKLIKQYSPAGLKVAASFVGNQRSDLVYDGVDFIMLSPLPVPTIGFTPVQQGGGTDMTTEKVYIGWDSVNQYLLAQVNSTALGRFVFQSQLESRITDTQNLILGVGQSWLDMTASRAKGVTYTNGTGRTIALFIKFDPDGGDSTLYIDGHNFSAQDTSGTFVSFVIPPGGTYSLSAWGVASVMKWLELR